MGDFNTPVTPMDRSTKHKINKETQTLSDTMDQSDLIDIYWTFHPKSINFTFFSSAHGIFSRIDHILGHKSSLGKFKEIEIIPVIFSDQNEVRLDLNCRKKTIKNSNRRSQDGGGIGRGDHFLFYKFIEKNNRTVNKVYKTTSDP